MVHIWKSEDKEQESALSFHLMVSRDRTQVFSLGGSDVTFSEPPLELIVLLLRQVFDVLPGWPRVSCLPTSASQSCSHRSLTLPSGIHSWVQGDVSRKKLVNRALLQCLLVQSGHPQTDMVVVLIFRRDDWPSVSLCRYSLEENSVGKCTGCSRREPGFDSSSYGETTTCNSQSRVQMKFF